MNQLVTYSGIWSVNHLVRKLVNQSDSQSVSQAGRHSDRQTVS